MPKGKIITDWICIATSGTTVDGRVIEENWLKEAAASYSRSTYTAMIWPHHPISNISERQFTYNLGEIDELKTEQDGTTVKLYAKICPNQFLINVNSLGQKLFSSAEFLPNFGDTGKTYLLGMCVTDIPASLGTEKIIIPDAMKKDENHSSSLGSIETFSINIEKNASNKPSVWSRLFSADKQTGAPKNNDYQPKTGDGTNMSEPQNIKQPVIEQQTPASVNFTHVSNAAAELADAADDVIAQTAALEKDPSNPQVINAFNLAKQTLDNLVQAFSQAGQPKKRRVQQVQQDVSAQQQLEQLQAKMDGVLEKFSLLENGAATKTPAAGPADTKAPFDFM